MTSGGQQVKTLVVAVALMMIAGFAPAMVLGVLGHASSANVAVLAGMAVLIACVGGAGWRTGIVIAAPFACFAGLAVWAAPHPWPSAIVLATAAFLRGYAAKVGLHDALAMTVISLGFLVASPPGSDTAVPEPMSVALVVLASALWGTFVMFLLRGRLRPRNVAPLDPIRVVAYSLALAALVGVATWFVVDLGLGHTGGWVILTVVVVFQPSLGAGFTKAAQRAAGTVLGFVLAIAVGALVPAGPVLYLVGSAFSMVAFVVMLQGRPYWLFATFLTPAIVLLESAGSTVARVAEERLGATLVGVVFTTLVMLALTPFAKRLASADASPAPAG